MKNILIVSVHPDDETLGCGGTILRHKKNGDKLFWLIITSMSEIQGFSKERIADRAEEINKVGGLFGFEKTFCLNYLPMTLDGSTLQEMIPEISKIILNVQPEIIYTVNRSDAHSDHRISFDAVMACTKSFRYPFVKSVLMYECISETEFAPALPENCFIPNYFVDISDFLKSKLEIMQLYKSETGAHPFPRSLRNIEALAIFRGATAGVEYAEAFQLVKWIDK